MRALLPFVAPVVKAAISVRQLLRAAAARVAPCLASRRRAPIRRRPRACSAAVTRLRAAGIPSAADAGMTTAEYAVGTVAACGFAAVLYKVVTSDAVSKAITGLIQRSLDAGF
jgi:hypothetical protein